MSAAVSLAIFAQAFREAATATVLGDKATMVGQWRDLTKQNFRTALGLGAATDEGLRRYLTDELGRETAELKRLVDEAAGFQAPGELL